MVETDQTAGGTDDAGVPRYPDLPWCRECWSQAAEGTREERENELPDECEECGSTEVFWI